MKVTITLTDAEVKGLKKYLLEVNGEKATSADVKMHIEGIVSGYLQSPHNAESDYINEQLTIQNR